MINFVLIRSIKFKNSVRLSLASLCLFLCNISYAQTYTTDSYRLSSIKHPDIISEFNQFLEQEKTLVLALEKKFNLK